MNKLDYLAQKEAELRALNDQLDERKDGLLQERVPRIEDSYQEDHFDDEADPDAAFKGVPLRDDDEVSEDLPQVEEECKDVHEGTMPAEQVLVEESGLDY